MPNPARRIIAALALLAAAIVAGAVALDLAPAAAQSDDEQADRIVARRLDDGRTEFGWQPAGAARVLPRARYFPANAQVGRWLNSSPVEVDGAEIGRINARLRSDGRIEFGFTPTDGARILPSSRYFPVDARVGRWLRSTEITIGTQSTIGQTAPAASTTAYSAISAGHEHTCAIRTGSGEITCWGGNADGQADAPAGSFSAVSAGEVHTCAIRADTSAIECWGSNHDWQEIYRGQADPPAGSFSAVSAGSAHSCGLRESGAIECWGSNSHRYWNDETEEYEESYTGQADAPAGSFSAVSAGEVHTCAIRADTSAIECWGSNHDWQEIYRGQADPPAGSFSAVSAGSAHSCGLRESGAIECWGSNSHRYWNDETEEYEESYTGQADAPAGSFSAIVAGSEHTCAIRTGSGAIECWGKNDGDLGFSDDYDDYAGQADAPPGSFSAVSAGGWHTCAIRESGAIECWGDNRSGQSSPPAGSFSAVSAGSWHTCAIRESGAIECWGHNYYGQTDAPAGSFTAVSASRNRTCAIRAGSGAIECWGDNYAGGLDAPAGSFTAVSLGSGTLSGQVSCTIHAGSGAIECWGRGEADDAPAGSFSAVSVGSSHACAIRDDGAIECWGSNWFGETDAPAGSFSAVSASTVPPFTMNGGKAGGAHTCAIRESGAIECWGDNTRSEWNDETKERVEVYAGKTDAPAGRFRAVSASQEHICAIRAENGEITCWGYNDLGQSKPPAGRFTAISATCAIRTGGAIECWGWNPSIIAAR